MSTGRARPDATPSTRGTIHHLCVAVQKCYELRQGQKLLIEELGDITVENEQQIEVKQYSDNLTDGHSNFWNTLRNWIDEKFDHTPYSALILHTTQEFGAKATISAWNDLDSEERLNLLLRVNEKFEAAYKKAKSADPKKKPGTVLKLQRFILETDRRSKLESLIGKVWIEARAKALPDLYEELKQDRIRGVLTGKKNEYLDALIGFVCRADKKTGESWEITYEDFNEEIGKLTATYNNETRIFPRKHFRSQGLADCSTACDNLFIQKIRDIEYHTVINKAIHDYEATISTLHCEFSQYSIDEWTIKDYVDELENRFRLDYSTACIECSHELKDSKIFYNKTVGSPAPALPGFGDTPDGFRNGLLHQRMDAPDTDLQWKVRKQ